MIEYFSETKAYTAYDEAARVKKLLAISYALKVLSMSFLIVASVTDQWLWLIGLFIVYTAGICFRQRVLSRTDSYEYFYVRGKIVISRINNFGRRFTLAEIEKKNIISIDEVEKSDFMGLNAISDEKSIIKMRFFENSESENILYFSPSLYLISLIKYGTEL